MKKEGLIILIALFALAFTFGCTMGGEKSNNTNTGNGYTLKVSPKNVISEGVITIDLRLKNIFDNDMNNVEATIKDIPSTFTGTEKVEGVTIVKGQEYPMIWSITTPSTDLKQSINPKVEVCFDYTTNFYFDTALVPRDKATEEVQVQSGYSNGPISVTQMGLDKIFLKEDGTGFITGSLDIKNNWQGHIQSINKITITPSGLTGGIKYASCGGDTVTTITPSTANCGILNNNLAIGDGLITTIKLSTTSGGSSISTERTNGEVDYTYCYDIPLGTITVCPVGQRC